MSNALSMCVVLALMLGLSEAGVATFYYKEGQHAKGKVIKVYANSLTSTDGVIPYPFYHLPFCKPGNLTGDVPEEDDTNMGMTLRGERIYESPYTVKVLEEEKCRQMCAPTLSKEQIALYDTLIKKRYRGNLILDNLPVIRIGEGDGHEDHACKLDSRVSDIRGFALGGCSIQPMNQMGEIKKEIKQVYVYNHLSFNVMYNSRKEGEDTVYFIVGFVAKAESFSKEGCQGPKLVINEGDEGVNVPYTYSVTWEEKPDYDWGMRWDYYLESKFMKDNAKGEHWQKIMLSFLIILCMTGVIALILMRTLHLDFNRYNNPDNEDEMQEEVGWKLVHTDVFRPPPNPNLFAALIGIGVQVLGMSFFCILFALLGILSPSKRGNVVLTVIFLFVLMAFLNGYVTGSLQMMFATRQWKTVILAGASFPGFLFTLWAITEIKLNQRNAASAVDIGTVMSVIALWVGVCLPQAVLGASFSYRQNPITNPLRYQSQARQIPPQRWMFSIPATIFLPGIIPYAAAHYELDVLMRSIWQGKVLHLFVFLATVFVVVVITVSETVLITIYYQLVFEDYRWWWKSFLIPSGMGVYYLIFSACYFNSTLQVSVWSLAAWMYVCFCLSMSIAIVLAAGTIGFFSSWLFIRIIYTAIKIE